MMISCIMPTTIRRAAWIKRSIALFNQQDYPDRELIIASEDIEVYDLVDGLAPNIHFVPTYQHIPLGQKRNQANAYADGQYIAHWDDDDWYAPWRLMSQLRAVTQLGANQLAISGCRSMFFYDLPTDAFWRYTCPKDALGAPGATLFYPKAIWDRCPFDSTKQTGSDFHWQALNDYSLIEPEGSICIATSHHDNTSPRRYQNSPVWAPYDGEPLLKAVASDWFNSLFA